MAKKKIDDQLNIDDSQLSSLQTELDSLKDLASTLDSQLKRAVADYQNLEKRVAEGRSELNNWAAEELIRKIVPVIDHMNKAINGMSDEEKSSAWFQGIRLSILELKKVLSESGLEEVSVEGDFDPSIHEAVDTREGRDGEILEVVELGYKLNGKIMKPAKVIVGKEIN